MKKIVITGATGFIGLNLVNTLISQNYKVVCLSRSIKSLDKLNENSKKLITDYSVVELEEQLKGCDILIHLAGRRITRDDRVNAIYPFVNDASKILDNLLEACVRNKIKKIIIASSIGIYSDFNKVPYSENDTPKPSTLYGLTKLFSEQRVDFFSRKYNIDVAHIRLAQCYGYGEKSTPALMNFIKKAINKEEIVLNNKGLYPIDEIYIEDAIAAFIALIKVDRVGSFNIGSGRSYSILELATAVNQVFNNQGNLSILPFECEIKDKHMDIRKAKNELNWKPKFSLENGLKSIKKFILDEEKNR